jgi:hypothetical protein
LLAERAAKNGDKKRVLDLTKPALADVELARSKVERQQQLADATPDAAEQLAPPTDIEELEISLKNLQRQASTS